MAGLTTLTNRIILTVGYFDQFNYPLRLLELYQRVPGHRIVKIERFAKTVASLVNQGYLRLEKRNGCNYVSLAHRYGLSAQRLAGERWKTKKLAELESLLRFIQRFLPWVEGVAVTGSVGAGSAHMNDDTDLLIVTRPGNMWLVRPVLIAYAWWHGKRRSWRKEEPNSWCFNLWLETNRLQTPGSARSIYVAHEVLQAQWVLDKSSVTAGFLAANAWVQQIYPRWYVSQVGQITKDSSTTWCSVGVELILRILQFPLQLLNVIAFGLQLLYMQPHRTRERVQISSAFFHPRDTQRSVYLGWQRSLSQWTNASSFDTQVFMRSAAELPPPVQQQLLENRAAGAEVVLVTGVFDVLHEEHVVFLQKSAQLGDFLLVAIESDARVRDIKGPGRPVNTAAIRAQQVLAVSAVHAVVVLPEAFTKPDERMAFLRAVQPQFLAVSAHTAHLDKKRQAVKLVGGQLVVVHEQNPAVSSSQLLAQQSVEYAR